MSSYEYSILTGERIGDDEGTGDGRQSCGRDVY